VQEETTTQLIATDLMRYAGRVTDEPRDHGALTRLYDDRNTTEVALAGAFGEEEPDWWIQLGSTDWMLLAFGETAVVVRSPEQGGLEVERIGSLAGGVYTESWAGERGTLSFTHERLPASVTIPVGRYANERDARASLQRWAQQPLRS
jgi:hypothetical protein